MAMKQSGFGIIVLPAEVAQRQSLRAIPWRRRRAPLTHGYRACFAIGAARRLGSSLVACAARSLFIADRIESI
jgi:hypothetical protein